MDEMVERRTKREGPMASRGRNVSLDSIHSLLRRASAQSSVAWASPHERIVVTRETARFLHASYRVPFVGEKIVRGGEWTDGAGVYQEIQNWIETHWSAGQETEAPTGHVASKRPVQFAPRDRLDTPTAARKLILAAMLHGPKAAAGSAKRFAQTGLLEVESVYLMKGPAIAKAVDLDESCTLIPYREAVRFRESLLDLPPRETWPPEHADGICALRARGFESPDSGRVYMSPLLRPGHPEALALLLGVAWGDGYTVFGHWHLVPLVTSAALPFWSIGPIGGSFQRATLLPLQMGESFVKKRPLASEELVELVAAHARLRDQPRKILNLAMRRIRDSDGRIDFEDKIIDVCIALEALFTDKGWEPRLKTTISRRGSWYYADTVQERDGARRTLQELYEIRRNIVHGNTIDPIGLWPDAESSKLLAEGRNILRACLKSMIANGIPDDWEGSGDHRSIWRNPARPPSAIPSTKSDSLSWSVEEREEIDKELERVWKPTIAKLPDRPADSAPVTVHHSPNLHEVSQHREQGIPCVIAHPARLYMAHPKWPKESSDEPDARTLYYVPRDVERHLQRWQRAANESRADCFVLDNVPELYHPRYRQDWLRPLK